MVVKVHALEAKNRFSELMETVAYTQQRFLVERRGKPMMAWVPAADLAKLEQMENEESSAARRRRLAEWLAEADRLRKTIEEHLDGRELPSAADLLREAREERMA
jgi:prevent-host-death family protein